MVLSNYIGLIGTNIKPSIAQLEERGTVIRNLSSVLSRGRWFEPGSKDIVFFLIVAMCQFAYRSLTEQVVCDKGYNEDLQQYTKPFQVTTRHLTSIPCTKVTKIRNFQSPIQLLLPPGLCSVVCPILTTPVSVFGISPTRLGASLDDWSPETRKGLSIASINGLGGTNGVDVAVMKEPCPSTQGMGPAFGVSAAGRSTGRNDSAYHSYHTCR
jgi:hypothetical protein